MLSKAVGYKNYFLINNKKSINEKLKKFLNSPGSSFLEIKINVGTLNKLGRPSNFQLIKKKFIN